MTEFNRSFFLRSIITRIYLCKKNILLLYNFRIKIYSNDYLCAKFLVNYQQRYKNGNDVLNSCMRLAEYKYC